MLMYTPYEEVTGGEVLAVLSRALFSSSIEPTDLLDLDKIRREVLHTLGSDFTNECLMRVAQSAGDYPELYFARMSWCRTTVSAAFFNESHYAKIPQQLRSSDLS
ncbi:hypothetical protein [Streptomyces sp. NPDC088748]|uniref:hypothetical protein n=1 Tax=Streptomyces sp. NPDC088748 TaxID=3365887 RepID=UPI003820E81A